MKTGQGRTRDEEALRQGKQDTVEEEEGWSKGRAGQQSRMREERESPTTGIKDRDRDRERETESGIDRSLTGTEPVLMRMHAYYLVTSLSVPVTAALALSFDVQYCTLYSAAYSGHDLLHSGN